MPRKIRAPADPVANRQNQQRCRARQKEYVAGLEERLREYESRGVRASLQMQQAAREVAWKNGRLLVLLGRHGVSREEVDAFLRDGAGGGEESFFPGGGVSGSNALAGMPSREEPHPPFDYPGRSEAARVDDDPVPSPVGRKESPDLPSSEEVGESGLYKISPDSIHQQMLCSSSQSREPHDHTRKQNNEQPVTVCSDRTEEGQNSRHSTQSNSLALVTSCDAAATIIADFQGHGDAVQARDVLGCGNQSNCHVKNTRLFQLMDETA